MEFEKPRHNKLLNPEENKDREMVKANRKLKNKGGARALHYVTKLHKNLGHPSPEVLVKMLTEAQATKNVLQSGNAYTATTITGQNHFNHLILEEFPQFLLAIVVVDFSWFQLETGHQYILIICDELIRYIVVRILQSEKSTEFIKSLNLSFWIAQVLANKYYKRMRK